jgi:hypothetical protein
MKKLKLLLILSFLAVIAFQSCKTRQRIDKIGQGDTTKIRIARKDTIINTQISDTNLYVFSNEAIFKIKEQIPYGISLIPGIPYSSSDLYKELKSEGNENPDSYVTMAKKNGNQTTQKEIIEKNTQYYLNALETGEPTMPPGKNVITSATRSAYLKKIGKLPPLIEQLFEGYIIFYVDQLDYDQPPHSEPTTIYRGKLTPLHKLINFGLQKNGEKLNLSFKEKLQVYLSLYFGFDATFSIKEIIDIPSGNDDLANPNFKLLINLEGQEKQCLIDYKYDTFYGLDIFNNENKYQGGSYPFN